MRGMGAAWTDRGNRVGRSEARRRVLDAEAKNYVYRRLREVLTGADTRLEFAHLSPSDRTAILEILRDTKPDFKLI